MSAYYLIKNTYNNLYEHFLSELCPPNFTINYFFTLINNTLNNIFVLGFFCGSVCQYSEKAMAPHSSTLAWKIPWMEEPSRLQSMGLLRVGHDWATSLSLFTCIHWRRKWQPTPVFLPGESQGWGSLMGCRLNIMPGYWFENSKVIHSVLIVHASRVVSTPLETCICYKYKIIYISIDQAAYTIFSPSPLIHNWQCLHPNMGFPSGSDSLHCRRPGFDPWVRKLPWRREWPPTPVLVRGESHGQRSLVCYSQWGHRESDRTEWVTLFYTQTHVLSQKLFFNTKTPVWREFQINRSKIIEIIILFKPSVKKDFTTKWILYMSCTSPSFPAAHGLIKTQECNYLLIWSLNWLK